MSLGSQLARAREVRGYRQEHAAASLGVSRAMVSYWETDRRLPNDRQLARLARLYRAPVHDLLSDALMEPHDEEAMMMFRGAEAELPEEARPGLKEFEEFLDGYARLAQAVGFEIRGMTQSPFVTGTAYDSADDARRKAEEVRAYLRLGLGPVADLDGACDLLGITVYRAALGEDLARTISGAFFNHPEVGFSILVNLETTPGRRNFTVAHEMAHALFHSGKKTPYILSLARKDAKERFADAFAGEYLMPTEGIRRIMEEHGIGPRIADPSEVIHLQRFFRVSYPTALVRLRQAKIISQADYEGFQLVRPVLFAKALGYEVDEEELAQDAEHWRVRRFPHRFLRLLREALTSETISVPTAASLTGLSIDEVTDLMTGTTGTTAIDAREFDEFSTTGVLG